jgi:hypothetical protein
MFSDGHLTRMISTDYSAPSAGRIPIWNIRAQRRPASCSPPRVTAACNRRIAPISCVWSSPIRGSPNRMRSGASTRLPPARRRISPGRAGALDWTKRFPPIAADIGRLPAGKLIIDAEAISADAKGHPSFSALQDDLKHGRYDRMVYYAFDLLHLDGFDTRAAPLVERKRVLQSFLAEAAAVSPLILYSEHFENGMDLFGRATAMGWNCIEAL